MKKLLRRCNSCAIYTLKSHCPKCGSETSYPHPAPFSPDDKYARYRIAERYTSS
ncbi:MAG: RNA-protein complex protein Nop10 [Nitrososphaerales archaeon]|nr:RNA-protein complex protein Nop10 [Nitrososphaerales archaeon]